MLTELDVARRRARPLRAARSSSARPTARCSRRSPAALDAGPAPILCVGETEAEREAGDTERKLRHQVQEGLAKVADERLADVVIAYEPIWAIGTGLVATPEQAQEAIAFVRALVGDRSAEQAERVRILYGGSSSPTTPPSCSRCPTSTARWSAAPRSTRSPSRRSSRPRAMSAPGPSPVRLPRRARRLGAGAAPARATPSRSPTRRCSTSCGSATRTPSSTRPGAPSGLPEGQMGNSRGRPPQPRRRRRGRAGPHAHRRRGGGRRRWPHNEVLREAFARRRARPPDRPGVRRRRALRLAAPGGADRAWARELGVPDLVIHAFTDGRDTLPHSGAGSWRPSRTGAPRPATRGSAASSAATTRWTATRAGTARSSPTTCSSTAAPSTARRPAPRRSRAAYERGETDEFVVPVARRRRGADPPRRPRHRLQLPPRPHAPDHARARRARLRRDRPRRRAAGRALRDDGRVRGGLALSGRVPARSGRR